jgi:bifunctional non-homologous end joining protein LigD
MIVRELRDIATTTRQIKKREDKVYLDFLQNRHGQLIVAPFSVRPLPGATVSMPLRWDEVDQSLDPRAFTIKTALQRMESLGADPCAQALTAVPDLGAILQRLAAMMAAS